MQHTTQALCLGLLVAGACAAPEQAPVARPVVAAVVTDPPIVVGALSLMIAGSTITLGADGTVSANDKTVATFVGADVRDAKGALVLHVDQDGRVTGPDVKHKLTVTPTGDLHLEDGSKILIREDDGLVVKVDPTGKTEAGEYRFDGVRSTTRRAAALLFVLATLPKTVQLRFIDNPRPPK